MAWHVPYTLVVVGAATWALARERLGPDVVMFLALCLLVVGGVVTPRRALVGFGQPAVATIAVLLVVAGAVSETGALKLFSNTLLGRGGSPTWVLLRIMVPTATMSAFLNNTPIVAMFIPMIRSFARKSGISSSKLLLPLSWAAMFGGTCTMIGTSANLVVRDMLAQSSQGVPPLGVLEIGLVGVPTTIVGVLYLALIGHRLIPAREDPVDAAFAEAKDYLVELRLASNSPLVGSTIEDAGLRALPGLFLFEIRRDDGHTVSPVTPRDRLRARDHLVFTGIASTVHDLIAEFPGLVPVDETVLIDEPAVFEVVISHRSPLVGLTVRDADFRHRYGAAIVAVHRAGHRIVQKIGDIRLEPGDTLMLWAPTGFHESWKNSAAFYLVSDSHTEAPMRYPRARLVLLAAVAMVVVPTATGVPLLVAAMGALVLLFVTGSIGVRTARSSLNWQVLVLIGSAFGVAQGLADSGAAELVAQGILAVTEPIGPRATLVAVYILGVVVASFVSNAAGAALLFPIAMDAAALGSHDPRPFAIAIAMAASAGFSTPIGCAPNLLVYGPGGYRYLDFTRVGLPLNVLFLIIAVVVIPLWWPFA